MRKTSDKWSVAQFIQQQGRINFDPEYQRQGNVWPTGTREDFIDSLLNGFDIPKLYLHELVAGEKHSHSIIDGKQRIKTVLDFVDSKFPLGDGFRIEDTSLYPAISDPPPKGGHYYKDFPDSWRQCLRDVSLDVILIPDQPRIGELIEELFERLNSGVALSGTEKRHAKTGQMSDFIKDIVHRDFFVKNLPFPNTRYKHEEIAARIVKMAHSRSLGGSVFTDFKRGTLDRLVEQNRQLTAKDLSKLTQQAKLLLGNGEKVFGPKDHLLSKHGLIPGYLAFIHQVTARYALSNSWQNLHEFIETFEDNRNKNRDLSEQDADPNLSLYTELAGQGLTSLPNLEARVEILIGSYLSTYPETVVPKDPNRIFSQEERWAIWIKGGKKCQECGRVLPDLSSMHADHKTAWANGGPTTIENAQSLCETCNLTKGGSN